MALRGRPILSSPARLVRAAQILAVNALLVVALCCVAEGLLRFAGADFPRLARGAEGYRILWTYDATIGWFHRPGASAPAGDPLGPGQPAPLAQINALGLRGAEPAAARAATTPTIAILGDSFVFGHGVSGEETLSARLEALLRRSEPEAEHRVLNLGVHGYSTDQEYLLLRRLGEALAPDLVILIVCDNDFVQNTEDFAYNLYYKPWFEVGPEGRLYLRNVPVPRLSPLQQAKLWLARRSQLWNLLRSRRSSQPAVQRLLDLFQVGVARRAASHPVRVTFALVKAIDAEVRRLGARLLITHTAHRGEDAASISALEKRLTHAGLTWLPMRDALEAARHADPTREWQFGRDPHWNAAAHAAVAEILFRHLRDSDALPVRRRERAGSTSTP